MLPTGLNYATKDLTVELNNIQTYLMISCDSYMMLSNICAHIKMTRISSQLLQPIIRKKNKTNFKFFEEFYKAKNGKKNYGKWYG